ncbi:MAG: hypothetical protein JRE82_16025 [Deltaproteobacteria bacterium]|nr:hypothetical protein [Deltaproteobacteria bacterium]
MSDEGFKFKAQRANVEVKWFEEWTSRYGETLPEPLPPQENWQHPILSDRYAGTMHEDSFASDVSHFPGPIPANSKVGYFHVLEKGKHLSGMAPLYTFLDDQTVVTISFGRDAATLIVIDISSPPPRVLDRHLQSATPCSRLRQDPRSGEQDARGCWHEGANRGLSRHLGWRLFVSG